MSPIGNIVSLALFSATTLLPVPLLAAGAVWGGWWVLAALASVTVLIAALDRLVTFIAPPRPEAEFPAHTALSLLLAACHFGLLALIVWGFGRDTLSLTGKLGLLLAAGLYFGQVSNSNAHELIHRGSRFLHDLGMWVYISLLFGHHTSAHVLVHHRKVATRADPNSARLGESFYRYVGRAWRGSFREGYAAERARLERIGRDQWRNPYVTYVGGGLAMIVAAGVLGGVAGVIGYVLLALHAQGQLLLSDYVQHYGLMRRMGEDGRPEPVGARHSWNAPHWASAAFMLNAPRHSDHHARPARAYPALELPADAPQLPRPLPTMAMIALIPPLWRRMMDPRVTALQA